MAEQKFKPSVKLANAISMVMEQDPADWGAGEQCTMLRYLVLQCSDRAALTVEQIKALPKDSKATVNLSELATVFYETGKIAECANFKKFLVGGDYPNLGKKAETKYA
jgi:hypothetical protein